VSTQFMCIITLSSLYLSISDILLLKVKLVGLKCRRCSPKVSYGVIIGLLGVYCAPKFDVEFCSCSTFIYKKLYENICNFLS